MSTTIDNRVVSMKFNNQQFESGVKTSLGSIEKLKASLNFDGVSQSMARGFSAIQNSLGKLNFDGVSRSISRGFYDIDRSISMSGISNSVDNISNRFSALGVVGMTVLQNLTTSAMGLASKLGNIVINPIVEGGKRRALNIEQAKFQLQGLDVAWEDIEDDINYGVQDTAYGLDSAAKVASQLVASNVTLGDDMKQALRGISGVAAMTNSSYEEIGHIFTTVAGQGRLMGMQLTQLSLRGLNVAAELGKALGKSEAEIRDMASKGQIDFNTFARIMNEKYGGQAKKANETFTGAMSNVRAAFSRIGAKFATPAFENIRLSLVGLIPVINNVNKAIDPLVELFVDEAKKASDAVVKFLEKFDEKKTERLKGVFTNVADSIKNLKDLLISVSQPIKKAIEAIFPEDPLTRAEKLSSNLEKLTKKFKIGDNNHFYENVKSIFTLMKFELTQLKPKFDAFFGNARTLLSPFADIFNKVSGAVDSFFTKALNDNQVSVLYTFINVVGSVLESFLDFSTLMKFELAQLKPKFDAFFENARTLLSPFGMALEKAGEFFNGLSSNDNSQRLYTLSQILASVVESFLNLGTAAVRFASPIKDAILEMFPTFGMDSILSFAQGFSDFTEKLIISDETAENLKNTFKGFLAVLDIAAQLFSAVFRIIFPSTDGLFKLGGGLLSVTGGFGEWLVKLRDVLKENDVFYIGIRNIILFLKTGVDTVKEKLRGFAEVFEQITGKELRLPTLEEIAGFFDKIKTTFSWVPGFLTKVKDSFKELFNELVGTDKSKITETLSSIFDTLSDITEKNGPRISEFLSNLGDAFDKIDIKRLGRLINIALLIVFVNALIKLRGVISSIFSYGRPLHNFNGILNSTKSAMFAFTENIKADTLMKIAKAIGMLTVSLVVLASIEPARLASAMFGLTHMFVLLFGAMTALTALANHDKSGWGLAKAAEAVTLLSASMMVLALAVEKLGSLTSEQLGNGMITLIGLLSAMMLSVNYIPVSKGKDVLTVAAAMIILSGALVVMAKAFKIFAGIENGLKSLMLLAGIITVFGAAAMIFSAELLNLAWFAEILGSFAVAMLILAPALMKLDKIEHVIGTLGLLAGTILILGVTATAFSAEFAQLTLLAKILAAFGVALLILAPALKILDSVENAVNVLKLLGGAMLVLGAFTAMFSEVIPMMPAMAGALILVATALLILAPAMKLLSTVSFEEICKGLLIFASVLGSVLVTVFVLQYFVSSFTAFAAILVMVGVGLAVLGVGITSVSNGLMLLAAYFNLISKVDLAAIGKGLLAFVGTLAIFIAAFVGIAAILIPASIPIWYFIGLLTALFAMIAVGSVALTMFAPILDDYGKIDLKVIGKGLLALAGGLLVFCVAALVLSPIIGLVTKFAFSVALLGVAVIGVAAILGGLVYVTGDAITKFMQTLINAVPTLVDLSVKLVIAIINGVAGAIKNNADAIMGALRNLLGSVLVFAMDVLEQIIRDYIPMVGEKLGNGIAYAKQCVSDYWTTDEANNTGEGFGAGLLSGFTSGFDISSVTDGMTNTLGGVDLSSVGGDLGVDFSEGLGSTEGLSFNAGALLGDSAEEGLGVDLSSVGNGLGIDFSEGLEGTEGLSFDAGSLLGDSTIEGLDIGSIFKSTGSDNGKSYSSGILSEEDRASDAGNEVANVGVNAMKLKYDDFRETGVDAGRGFADGLYLDNRVYVRDSAGNLAQIALNAMTLTLDEHSPSKKMRYIGLMAVSGFIDPFEEGKKDVEQASKSLAQKALAIEQLMSTVNDEDISDEPVITPVVDLSNVNKGANEIDGMLAGKNVSVSGVVSYRNADGLSSMMELRDSQANRSADILNEVARLRGELSGLRTYIGNLQVRLDSGALVGEIAAPMNHELGRIAARQGRYA